MKRTVTNRGLLLTSAVAAILGAAALGTVTHAESAEKVKCYGVNKCKGVGSCGGKGHSCAGKNSCKGSGYLKLDAETCLKIEGGRLTPKPPKS